MLTISRSLSELASQKHGEVIIYNYVCVYTPLSIKNRGGGVKIRQKRTVHALVEMSEGHGGGKVCLLFVYSDIFY